MWVLICWAGCLLLQEDAGPAAARAAHLHRGSSAVGSCTICTIRGLLVPISTSRMLNRNCREPGCASEQASQPGWGGGARRQAGVLWRLQLRLTPRNASSRDDLPSDCPPMATISGMGRLHDSPKATAAACRRLHGTARAACCWSKPALIARQSAPMQV